MQPRLSSTSDRSSRRPKGVKEGKGNLVVDGVRSAEQKEIQCNAWRSFGDKPPIYALNSHLRGTI